MQPPKWIFDALPGAQALHPPPVGYAWWVVWDNAGLDIGLGLNEDGRPQVDTVGLETWADCIVGELHQAHKSFRDFLDGLADETGHIPTSHQLRAARLAESYARRLVMLAALLRKCP